MSRVGILGGSFNPPTYAHLQLGVFARDQFSLDEILLVPCSVSGFKGDIVMENQHHRYNMTMLASFELDGFKVLDIDLFKDHKVYAYESIKLIRKFYPDDDLFYIAGSDSIASVGRWKNPSDLVSNLHFVIAHREGTSLNEAMNALKQLDVSDERIHELDYPLNNLSSTIVRYRLAKGFNCDCLTPPSVLKYISVHGLYEKEDDPGR